MSHKQPHTIYQRTNGLINSHLIFGPTVSIKTNKIGQSQPRVIIYISFVELESPIRLAKFQDQRTSGSGEQEDFRGFYDIWAWRPSWSCDPYHLHKLSFPLPKEDSHEIWHLLANWLQRRYLKIMVIYMYTAQDRDRQPPWVIFYEQYYSVKLVLCCKFSSIK